MAERARTGWRKRRAKAQGYQEAPIVGVATRVILTAEDRAKLKQATGVIAPTGDPWHDLPLDQALAQLTKLQFDLKHAQDVITRRTDLLPKVATCWTALHRKDQATLPGMYGAYAKCVKTFPQEKAKFIDNCVIDPATGIVDPVFCCSNICYELYQTYRSRLKYKERVR